MQVAGEVANTKTHGKYATKIAKVGEKVETQRRQVRAGARTPMAPQARRPLATTAQPTAPRGTGRPVTHEPAAYSEPPAFEPHAEAAEPAASGTRRDTVALGSGLRVIGTPAGALNQESPAGTAPTMTALRDSRRRPRAARRHPRRGLPGRRGRRDARAAHAARLSSRGVRARATARPVTRSRR